jgi:hypothetical protein
MINAGDYLIFVGTVTGQTPHPLPAIFKKSNPPLRAVFKAFKKKE